MKQSVVDSIKPKGEEKLLPHVKEAWVKALLRGDLRQAQGSLKKTNSEGVAYCCLGVLCDLGDNAKERWTPPEETLNEESWMYS